MCQQAQIRRLTLYKTYHRAVLTIGEPGKFLSVACGKKCRDIKGQATAIQIVEQMNFIYQPIQAFGIAIIDSGYILLLVNRHKT
ncbi:hypothetical protein D3C84_1156930 [compost metagenome]